MKQQIERLLRTVQRPGRYVGGEYGLPPSTAGRPSLVLAFPDLYEVGMSHWGTQILFWEGWKTGKLFVDRAFLPAPDLEAELRKNRYPLTSLASGQPLSACTMLGITVQHELSYTGVLALLELGGIPLAAADRDDQHPLVIAGGPGIANPAPLLPFIDAFVAGDGEGWLQECLQAGVFDQAISRADRRQRVAAIPGTLVPGLTREPVCRRHLADLGHSFHPRNMLVPNYRIIQERAVVEIARGCPGQCRFCQARTVYAPWRTRPPEQVRELARDLIAATGFDQLSFLSLNSGAYPGLEELIRQLQADFDPQHVALMLPSQSIAALNPKILPLLARGKKGTLTLAPEAATPALREKLNKHLSDEKLATLCQTAAKAGWRHVKLYFMIGLPGETEADVRAISTLVRSLPRQLNFNVTVSPFVPKAHTPLQWPGARPRAYLEEHIAWLRRNVPRRVKLKVHNLDQTMLEAAFARGGTELSRPLLAAYRAGARLDSWQDHFNFPLWQKAFASCGMDIEKLAGRCYAGDMPLPWDGIDYGVSKESLWHEYRTSITACHEATAAPR